MPESPGPLHLLPDAPITSPSFDRLDRMAFVRSFAEAIRAVKGTDSVVLALAGPWGSGKSSLLNLATGELRADEDAEAPLLIRFNPWWFTGTERLVAAFLQQFAAAVSRPEVRDRLGKATAGLDRLSNTLSEPGSLDSTLDPSARDIELIRDELNEIFVQSDRRILVFMDDIDRLTADEMTQLLLIVRAVADFPNTTYVLAFDHDIVCQAIGTKLGVDGRTYLEKVVQLQIDVPLPGRMRLERMVMGQLEAIDPAAQGLDRDAQRHFRMLFEGGIKHFLATPRACTRLLNVLRFTYPTLTGQVFFPDMLGICCLMSFSPQSIQAIRSASDYFYGHCDTKARVWIKLRDYHTQWLSQTPPRDRPAIEAIVRSLFPKVNWALNGPVRGEDYLVGWDRQKRICAPDHFESYFRLGLSAGEAAEHQWQNMVELLDDATAFARSLQRFGPLEEDKHGASWVEELLEQAASFVNDQATSEQAHGLFRALMRRGDQIAAVPSEDSPYVLTIDHIHRVVWVLVDCLLRIDDPAERSQVLADSVTEDAGLLTAAELLDTLDFRSDIFAEGRVAPTAEANTAQLLKVLKVLDLRIQDASQNGELAAHPRFMSIAHKWWQFGRKGRSRSWVRSTCEVDQNFVHALLQVVRSRSGLNDPDQPVEANRVIPIDLLLDFFDREELMERADAILGEGPEWLSPVGERVLQLLGAVLDESEWSNR